MDSMSLFLLLACSALTFIVARTLGKRLKARREAERAKFVSLAFGYEEQAVALVRGSVGHRSRLGGQQDKSGEKAKDNR